jgi:hypothetical protein
LSDAPQSSRAVPAIPVDEALELFLALTFPHGLPEGVDRARLVEQMRAKVAGDRPEWAAASQAAAPPAPAAPAASYSEVKAAAVEKALQPDLPSDPQERYLEERRREAGEHRAQHQEEARVEEARAELIRRLLARKREADARKREEPLQIQAEPRWTVSPGPITSDAQVLSLGLGQTFELGVPVAGALVRPEVDPAPAAPPRTFLPMSGPELAKVLRELTPDEQLAVLHGFGESRRALLKRREDLLADRCPSRKADRGEPLGFSAKASVRKEDLLLEVALEKPASPRARRERLQVR